MVNIVAVARVWGYRDKRKDLFGGAEIELAAVSPEVMEKSDI
jgi:hypothetical protein